MKHITKLFFGFCLLCLLASCGSKGNAKANFWVRGNCEMCKERIETTLEAAAGVADASYDIEAQRVTVSYDSTLVTVEALHQTCANVGHETKTTPAPDAVHDALPKCCKKGESM